MEIDQNSGFGTLKSVEYMEKFLSALNPLIVGILTCYIAYQQWQTNKRIAQHQIEKSAEDFKVKLYERRLGVYIALHELLRANYITGFKEQVDSNKFFQQAIESHFLFDDEIADYLDSVQKKSDKLGFVKIEFNSAIANNDTKGSMEKSNEMRELRDWLAQQFTVSKDKFKKYMQFK